MKIHHENFIVESNGIRVTYTDITDNIRDALKKSGVKDGMCVVHTPHTTCSILFEEYVHDRDWCGDEFLQVDFNRVLSKLVPRQLTESDYLYPGPKHVQFLKEFAEENPPYPGDPVTILNGDAHIKASIVGSSETLIIKEGTLEIGSFGYIYFIDWDQNRKRQRKCNVLIMGE